MKYDEIKPCLTIHYDMHAELCIEHTVFRNSYYLDTEVIYFMLFYVIYFILFHM